MVVVVVVVAMETNRYIQPRRPKKDINQLLRTSFLPVGHIISYHIMTWKFMQPQLAIVALASSRK